MDRRTFLKTMPALTVLAGSTSVFAQETPGPAPVMPIAAQDLQPITLLKPETNGGKSVLAALWERKTTRNIKPDKLPDQVLSNLLWAAFGINRQNGPSGRTGRTVRQRSSLCR
jgi:hypothetical protein